MSTSQIMKLARPAAVLPFEYGSYSDLGTSFYGLENILDFQILREVIDHPLTIISIYSFR
jgi:hypothetical protein